MESQEQRAAVSRIIDILRKLTRLVQLLPFAYLVIYAFALLSESILPDNVYSLIDASLGIPPVVVIIFLILSHLLKLCIWHKAACLIPMASRVVNIFDEFIMTLTQTEVIVINTLLGIATITFIIVAVKKLFGNGFQKRTA